MVTPPPTKEVGTAAAVPALTPELLDIIANLYVVFAGIVKVKPLKVG
jgi:hypothetical protein